MQNAKNESSDNRCRKHSVVALLDHCSYKAPSKHYLPIGALIDVPHLFAASQVAAPRTSHLKPAMAKTTPRDPGKQMFCQNLSLFVLRTETAIPFNIHFLTSHK